MDPANGSSEGREEDPGLLPDMPEWERDRLVKVQRLRDAGIEPYARSFEPRTRLGEVAEKHAGLGQGGKDETVNYRISGRVMARREHGKAVFMTLRDGWDDLQIYANVDTLGSASFELLTDIDVGDIIGCEGHVFRTRFGELTIFVK